MSTDVQGMILDRFEGFPTGQFGQPSETRLALHLDTVMQGRPRASSSRLLQMPAEVLANIVNFLIHDKQTLASLALVNSDCQELARSCQFAEVTYTYSFPTIELVLSLFRKYILKLQRSTFGPCIRKFTYAPRGFFIAGHHSDLSACLREPMLDSYQGENREDLRTQANGTYVSIRTFLLRAVSTIMPNLETFVVVDRYPLDSNFFQEVTQSAVRHLKLYGVYIEEPWALTPPLTPPIWPLRSLYLDVSLPSTFSAEAAELGAGQERIDHPMTTFFTTLFRLCGSSLEALTWDFRDSLPAENWRVLSLGDKPQSFPNLRHLRLLSPHHNLDTLGVLSLLYTSNLRSLEFPSSLLESHAALLPMLADSKPLRDLENLVLPHLPHNDKACMRTTEFIVQHRHVKKLYIADLDLSPNTCLDRFIIPALATANFSNLSCLSLEWGGGRQEGRHEAHIPHDSLAVVGAITSLEKLRLGAGISTGWRHQWVVDHTKLRASIAGLERLKMLALTRDTYHMSPDDDASKYYSERLVGAQELVDAKSRPELDVGDELQALQVDTPSTPENGAENVAANQEDSEKIWERAHRNRMLGLAESYAAVLPELEWMLCGQRPMEIQHLPGSPAVQRATPLTTKREQCKKFLLSVFGLGTEDDFLRK
ncbi:hypothetical protein N3K66_006365 [Trichothecium roseum]|uniref:Uncharacterized protein n=1 Tax=Trichothecium roseum TaxID=47278 RepID=A0ACC0UWY0_9HYPO|nr:hypothetical protein N3K66_006365 [Trichothecium roseum]